MNDFFTVSEFKALRTHCGGKRVKMIQTGSAQCSFSTSVSVHEQKKSKLMPDARSSEEDIYLC